MWHKPCRTFHPWCLCIKTRCLYNYMMQLKYFAFHYNDIIMSAMASQITSFTIVYSTVYSGAYERKHQSSASLAFVRGIHRSPVNSPHKRPVTRKMFPFDDVIIFRYAVSCINHANWFVTLHLRTIPHWKPDDDMQIILTFSETGPRFNIR